jgi:hypothetical protein
MNEKYFDTVFLHSSTIKELPPSFAILTACNPMDEALSIAENQKRNLLLLNTLCKLKKTITPITGTSRDQSHQEPSFVVSCSQGEATKLGKEFQQRAFFWVSNDQLEIIDCTTGMAYPAGLFSERIKE